MTKIIGLTGGIGSGKTTVAKHFLSLGIPIYIADDAARFVMESSEVINAIKSTFGGAIFDNNLLKREKLAEIVFNDAEKLKLLNEIVHPKVKEHFNQWLLSHNKEPFIIYEAAILFESGRYKECDFIITVTAPIDVRIQRVIQRDKTTREAVLKRMGSQWNDDQRMSKSDFIIENTDLQLVKLQILEILKILRISQNNT